MKPVEIAYFKHFMFDKQLAKVFVYNYGKYKFSGKHANPDSIEQYFLETTVKDVIMKAFAFMPKNSSTSRCSFDYWSDIDKKWQTYMQSNKDNFSNDSWPLLINTFSILRMNWDVPYYWKKSNFESTEEVYERMKFGLPLPNFRWKHGGINEKTEEDMITEEPEEPEVDTTTDEDPLAGFDFFQTSTTNNMRLGRNEVSLNFNNGSFKLTFNKLASIDIDNKGMGFIRLATNKAGDVCLVLSRDTGTRLTRSNIGSSNFNITLNSKAITTKIRDLLGITLTFSTVTITLLQSTPDYLIYKVTK